jgi:hypothetical protein
MHLRSTLHLAAPLGLAIAILGTGCGTSVRTSTGPSPFKCDVAVTMSAAAVGPGGGSGTVTVQTQAECAWSAVAEAPWITSLSPATGQGNGQVQFVVSSNPNPAARQADIVLNDHRVHVRQDGAPCRYEITPSSQTFPAAGGASTFALATLAGCSWTATGSAGWISITSGAAGSGSATIGFAVAANAGAARASTITAGDQTFAVTQEAAGSTPGPAPLSTYTIDAPALSIDADGGPAAMAVRTAAGCAWTAASNAAFITVVQGAGAGDGLVLFRLPANSGPTRVGTLTIAGLTLTVTQAGSCSATLVPASQSFSAAGGAGTPIAVSIPSGCSWTATASATWISVTSGATGIGNGTVQFSVAANTGAARTGSLTVGGQTVTISQAAACAASLNPASQSATAAGGPGAPIAVTIAAGCAWSAASNVPWLTVTSGASGSGNGTVNFTVAASTGPARTGTLTIAGQTFTVSQPSGCSYAINPTSTSAPKGADTGEFDVTTAAGCGWTAVSQVSWITITSGASGSGNGTVAFAVAANPGSARTGTILVGGRTFTVNQAKH